MKNNKNNSSGLILGVTLFILSIVLVLFTLNLKSNQGKTVHPILDILLAFIPSLIAYIGYGIYKLGLVWVGILSIVSLVFNIRESTRHRVGTVLTVLALIIYAIIWYMIISGAVYIDFEFWRGASDMP